jgi:hypothetical protein
VQLQTEKIESPRQQDLLITFDNVLVLERSSGLWLSRSPTEHKLHALHEKCTLVPGAVLVADAL